MRREELKPLLIDYGICQDNEFTEKYVNLICNYKNCKNFDEELVTNQHHIIPRVYYKNTNQKCDNSVNNLVTLPYNKHVLAHYYLYKGAPNKYKYTFACPLKLMINGIVDIGIDDEDLEELLSDEQINQIYKESNKHVSQVLMGHELFGEGSRGKIGVFKDNTQKFIKPEEVEDYLEKGWTKGCCFSGSQNYRWMTKDGETKIIPPNDVENMLKEGWKFGNLNTLGKSKDTIGISKDGINKYVKSQDLENYLMDGWKVGLEYAVSDQLRQRRKEVSSSSRWLVNDQTGVRTFTTPDKFEELFSQGYRFGKKPKNQA